MSFIIPNEADAFNNNQAEIDSGDIEILVGAYTGTSVISGCAVTAQGTPDMTVAVASGTIVVNDGTPTRATVASGNVTITAADGTNPRIDLIVCDAAGTKSATAGTAAAEPVYPAYDAATHVCLAAIYVPASDTDIDSNQITDKRVITSIPIVALADGTDGELITWDANGVPATVGVGSTGQILTSNGAGAAPTMQNILTNGVNNRIVTATGTSGLNGEANLTFDGSTLTIDGDISFTGPQNITTSSGDLTINPNASLNVSLTATDADSFTANDGTTDYYNIDTRLANTVVGHAFDVTNPSFASAAGSHFHLMGLNAFTWTVTGGVNITTPIDGVGLRILAPVIDSASATTITQLSTLYVASPDVSDAEITATTNLAAEFDGASVMITGGTIFMQEQADANADLAGYGQIWVNTATPNELWFTDDAGTDFEIAHNATTTLSSLASIGTITTGVWNGTDVNVADGGTGRGTATAYAVLCGGTTSTGAHQSIAGVGTSGQVLTSNGASSLPTMQDASAGGNGVIWELPHHVADTATLATATDANGGNIQPCAEIGNASQTGRALFGFPIPSDFSSASKLVAVINSNETGDVVWNIDSVWGASGELHAANTDSISSTTTAVTADQNLEIDITNAFTGIAADDYVGFRFSRLGADANDTVTTVRMLGFLMEYTV